MLYALWGVSGRCLVINTYYTYQDLTKMFNQDIETIKRKLSKMNIKKRYIGGSGKPYFLGLDIHSFMLFNKPFNQCKRAEKDEVKELIDYAV